MHTFTMVLYEKIHLRYIPIYDIIEEFPIKNETTTENGNFGEA